MGAYLTHPKTDKFSIEDANDYLVVAASSMQGWRNSQEDAHNAILKYDKNTSFFAVYDGHGGSEVATYCADHLPNFLKSLDAYKNGEIESALKQAFLDFDKTLLEPEVANILKELAGESLKETAELSCEDEDEDLAELHEESSLSLKKVLKRYGACGVKLTTTDDNDDDDDEDDDDENVDGGPKLSMPSLKLLKEDGQKPQSPYLRGRRAAAVVAAAVNKAVLDPDAKPAGSSTSSAAAAAAASKNDDAGPSTSSVSKMETDEDSTVSSTNTVANNLSNNIKLHNHASTAAESSLNDTEAEAAAVSKQTQQQKSTVATNGEVEIPDSSHIVKENEQNGSVTSSEAAAAKQKQQVSTSSTAQETNHNDAIVSGSSDVKKKQQNGNSATSSSAASTSAFVDLKKSKLSDDDSTDDDADYDVDDDEDDDEQQNAMNYSSDDEDDEDGDDELEEDDDDEDESDVDERHYVRDLDEEKANEEFCANMAEEAGQDSGCTAVVAVLHGRDLYVANAGDSRCIVCRNGKAIEMSLDHKPEDKEESARIYKAGGRVTVDGRVNGGLNLSRAIGDHAYKMNANLPAEEQMISASPDIKKLIITPEDEFMVLACDGIWNYMSNEEVVEFVRTRLAKIENDSREISDICEELFDNCLAPNTMGDGTGCDNMTAVIVRFKPKLQELETKIKPEECEDALLAKAALITLKRNASSSLDANDEPQQNKRLKTDSEEDNICLATSSAITSSTTLKQRSNSEQLTDATASNVAAATASSSSSSTLISTSDASTSSKSQTNDANECDSVIPDSSEAAAATS